MATTTERTTRGRPIDTPPLENGDRLTAAEFGRRYAAMPDLKKAELVEGVVYVAPPVSDGHGVSHVNASFWIGSYLTATPGLVTSSDGTVRLDPDNEHQPDVHLRILPEYGGRTRIDEDQYVAGAPELIVEVASSSVSYDLHDKLTAYRRNQVLEYVVWRVRDGAIDWFVLREGRYERLSPNAEGYHRSEVFPGLWLDPEALIRGDLAAVVRAVQRGLASPEHAAFAARMRERAAGQPRPPTGGERP